MTTPTGTIKMSDVRTEIYGVSSSAIDMNDSNVRLLAGIPSGAISMSNLKGKTWITFTNDTADKAVTRAGQEADATYSINANGTVTINGNNTPEYHWLPNNSLSGSYEIKAVFVGGDTSPIGTYNTYVNMGTDTSWTLTAPYGSNYSAIISLSIRRTGTTTVIATANVDFNADATL